jgi:hypothetical protein
MLSPPREPQYHLIESGEYAKCLLEADDLFVASETLREQCVHALRILHHSHDPPAYRTIATIFGTSSGALAKFEEAYAQYQNGFGPTGRPSILSDAQVDQLIERIHECFGQHRPLSMHELRDYIRTTFQKDMTANTLYHLLRRDPRVRSVHGVPCEDRRLEVPPGEIQRYFSFISEHLTNCPTSFVFNMDEMGHQSGLGGCHRDRMLCPFNMPEECCAISGAADWKETDAYRMHLCRWELPETVSRDSPEDF